MNKTIYTRDLIAKTRKVLTEGDIVSVPLGAGDSAASIDISMTSSIGEMTAIMYNEAGKEMGKIVFLIDHFDDIIKAFKEAKRKYIGM